jgi:hypothetical protein
MALQPDEIAKAGTAYIQALAGNADARSRFAAAGGDADAVASEVASVTGLNVTADDLPAIAQHINDNHQATVDQIAQSSPAMSPVVEVTT